MYKCHAEKKSLKREKFEIFFTYLRAGEFEIRKKTQNLRISTQQNLKNVRNPSKNQRKID